MLPTAPRVFSSRTSSTNDRASDYSADHYELNCLLQLLLDLTHVNMRALHGTIEQQYKERVDVP
jgi:hypothetical protein